MAFDTIKNIADVLIRAGKADEYKQILDLWGENNKMREQIDNLKKENEELKNKFSVKDGLKFRKNTYWLEDDGPFCSRCWDKEKQLLRMITSIEGGHVYRCPECKNYVDFDKNQRSYGIAVRKLIESEGPNW